MILNTNAIQLLVKNTEDLPVLPLVAQKILSLSRNHLANVQDLADILSLEPALAAKLLKVANSSLYNLRHEITTLPRAISLLGFDVVRNMVFSISVLEGLKGQVKEPSFSHNGLWEHSLASAILARSLMKQFLGQAAARRQKPGQTLPVSIDHLPPDVLEEAFMGGLFHDIGKILMDKFFPDEYWEIIQRASLNQENLWDLEREFIGVPHTELGDWLAQHWKLPGIFRWCISHHHLISHEKLMQAKEPALMALVVLLSDFFVKLMGIGNSANPWVQFPPESLWEMLALTPNTYLELLAPLCEQVDEVKESFGIDRASGAPDAHARGLLDRLQQSKILLATPKTKHIDPLAVALNSMGLRWDTAKIGKDLLEMLRSSKPDYVLLNLWGESTGLNELRLLMDGIRSQMTGPVLLFGADNWPKLHKELAGKGPIHGATMFPGKNQLVKELVCAGASVREPVFHKWQVPGNGTIELGGGIDEAGVAGNTMDLDLNACSHTEEIPWGTLFSEALPDMSDRRKLRHKSNYLELEPVDSGQEKCIGSCIEGKYQIVNHLSRGGMADIYRVKLSNGSKEYALKWLPFQTIRDQVAVRRFWQEAAQISTLKHPNVIRILDHSHSFNNHYYVMELATGWKSSRGQVALDVGNLAKPIKLSTSIAIIKQACKGLDYIHQQGFVHRDIKPANLLLFKNGCVKIADFGIARACDSASLTVTGMLVGTPEYVSPEQIEGKQEVTPASDIYSLGVLFYEMLTGISPFKRNTSLATVAAHIDDAAHFPPDLTPSIPDGIQNIVLRCLKKDTHQRIGSAVELCQEIDKQIH
jgi:HD-like signal output (HDOD) protein/tRNA A-37 threonylcarbamoyl transferase component Bud32